MTIVSGVVSDVNMEGKPSDFAAAMFAIAPTDTPFLTLCKKASATQTLHEWTTDDLAPPATNAQVEGDDVDAYTGSVGEDLNNRTQILRKAVKVTVTAQAITQAGVSNQYDYQLAQRMKEIKKDLELALLSNQLDVAGSTATARTMRGLPCWLTTNVSHGAGGASATAATPCVPGASRDVDEQLIKDVLQSCYEQGGNATVIMASPAIRSKLSAALTGGGTRIDRSEDKTVFATVDVYVSDYGDFTIMPNRVQMQDAYAAKCAFVIDPEYWAVAYLREFKQEPLAKTGDSMRGMITVEATLEARNQGASGMVADLK